MKMFLPKAKKYYEDSGSPRPGTPGRVSGGEGSQIFYQSAQTPAASAVPQN